MRFLSCLHDRQARHPSLTSVMASSQRSIHRSGFRHLGYTTPRSSVPPLASSLVSQSNFPSTKHQVPTLRHSTMNQTNTVLITGSSRGLGFTLAEWYNQNGWKVIATARSLDKADKLAALKLYKTVEMDTADEASIRKAAKELEGEEIDLLINNAGIAIRKDFYTETRETMLEQFTVNTVGPFLVSQAFMPHVKAAANSRGSAKIVHISSFLAGMSVGPAYTKGSLTGYNISKAALNMLHMSIAETVKNENVNIASISLNPGYVSTDMNGNAPGTITPEESVSAMVKVINNATLQDNGKFYSYDGSELAW